jgi:TPR repeat protein
MTSPLLLRLRALLPWERFACHQLGAMYATGDGLPKDEKAAIRWYRRGARRGDPLSQYDLGFMLLLGDGTEPDPEGAVRWLSRAADGGEAQAARLLAEAYAKGSDGVPRNAAEARRWAAIATRSGGRCS